MQIEVLLSWAHSACSNDMGSEALTVDGVPQKFIPGAASQ